MSYARVNAGFTNKPCHLLSRSWLSPRDRYGEIHKPFVRWLTYYGFGIILFVTCRGGSPPFRWGLRSTARKGRGWGESTRCLPMCRKVLRMRIGKPRTNVINNCKENQIFLILRHHLILTILFTLIRCLNKHSEVSCQTIVYSEQDWARGENL